MVIFLIPWFLLHSSVGIPLQGKSPFFSFLFSHSFIYVSLGAWILKIILSFMDIFNGLQSDITIIHFDI